MTFASFLLVIITLSFSNTSEGVNPIIKPIRNGQRIFEIRKFAQLPQVNKKGAQVTGFVSYANAIYVASSISGFVFKVTANGKVTKWFNAFEAVKKAGRTMNMENLSFSGVSSIAIHPSFWKTGIFYISYLENRPKDERKFRYLSKPKGTRRAICDSVVVEFRYNHKTKLVNPNTYREVLRIGLARIDHPIRHLFFQGWDLLITHGDSSHGYDAFVTKDIVGGGQNNDALGKILRINPLQSGSKPYTIPLSNPFRVNKKYLPEIYALGLRNPHTICSSKNWGVISVDVGRHNVEEINIIKPGGNYGWARREGTFVHLQPGGTNSGIAKLPKDDAKFGFIYPSVMYGHVAKIGQTGSNTAVAGACPIENGSKLNGIYIYANFPTGEIYYSNLWQMKSAVTTGSPNKLTQAPTFRPLLFYDHDGNPKTKSKRVQTFLDIVRMEAGAGKTRADLRLGRGPNGETIISSKVTGALYVITGSLPTKK